jgi:predicted phage baseplate assembly protein
MSRPLGVKGAVNPEDASGARDPDSAADARQNAPLTVLTLGRTVSLRDYEDFARAFGDIAKALATWSWDGQARRVYITVAGPNGAEVKADSPTLTNLVAAITAAGEPFVGFSVETYLRATFRLRASVKVDEPTYQRKDVHAAVEAALRDRFSFERRDFGQGVALSEVVAAMQSVDGVVGVNVSQLHRADAAAGLGQRLGAALPSPGPDGRLRAAELLTLDPAPLALGVMP